MILNWMDAYNFILGVGFFFAVRGVWYYSGYLKRERKRQDRMLEDFLEIMDVT